MNYYNDNDPFKAAWLRALIADGTIPAGDVDTRSIADVHPSDLHGYDQHHFFAGVGGWAKAFALAGISEDEPVASASCPCQPFSQTGKRQGFADARHLWPAFFSLVERFRFPTIFGEQVSSPDGLLWLDGVCADLEAAGYTWGAHDLCAAGVSAPQPRQRIFWVAYANDERPQRRRVDRNGSREISPWARGVGLRGKSGKVRRIEPGIEPLVDGFPERVALIEGAGDAIVPLLASEFIQASEEARQLHSVGI